MVDVFNAKLQKYYERRKKVKFNPKQITEIELKVSLGSLYLALSVYCAIL